MSHDHLGLFDTPPTRNEFRLGILIVGALIGSIFLILPFHDVALEEFPAYVPVINSLTLFSELIVAFLLYAQASLFRSRSLIILASAYVFTGLLLIPHALTFPGAFSEGGLLGAGVNTTAWLAAVRRVAFPVAVTVYILVHRFAPPSRQGAEPPGRSIALGAIAAMISAAAVTALTTLGHDLLPPFFVDRARVIQTTLVMLNVVVIALTAVPVMMLFRRCKSLLDLWLLVALAAWLIQALLNLPLTARFTLGWYALFAMIFLSSFTIMGALVAESNRLYAKLALSSAGRQREREDRLMSMDVLAGGISHEVGQPLSAMMLNVSAGLNWLDRPQPNVANSIDSLETAAEAGQRTFDVIKSVRTSAGEMPGRSIEFDLNDLVHETVSIMDRTLASSKVSIELELDPALPQVRGDPVQIKRVLVNLVTNAIEAFGNTRRRARSITVRSNQLNGQDVLLNVADSGAGIARDHYDLIFEPFFTTKASSAGLGLSLCRTVVAYHSGRLWASPNPGGGTTFHLQLPRSERSAVEPEGSEIAD